jgi:hypothetical protein
MRSGLQKKMAGNTTVMANFRATHGDVSFLPSGRANNPLRYAWVSKGDIMTYDLDRLVQKVDDEGFVVIRDFLDADLVETARREIDPYFEKGDEDTQVERSLTYARALPGKSPTLDCLLERIFSDRNVVGLLQAIAGKNFKIKNINARRMNGATDIGDQFHHGLPWHRDDEPEFTIGIVLADIEESGPGTGIVRGSHKWPCDPQWDVLLGAPFFPDREWASARKQGIRLLTRFNPFTRLLWALKVAPRIAVASGKQGDIYDFMNGTWHNRMSNTVASNGVIVLVNMYPTEHPIAVKTWSAETMARLPKNLARILKNKLPPNEPSETLVTRMLSARKEPPLFSLFGLARAERRTMNRVSRSLQVVTDPMKDYLRPAYRSLKRTGRSMRF